MKTYTIQGKPISINGARAAVKVKGKLRLITSAKARRWKETAVWELKSQRGVIPTMQGPCDAWIVLWMPTRAGDVDNYVKLVLDAVQSAGIIDNDKNIAKLTVSKAVDKANPRVEVSIATRTAA